MLAYRLGGWGQEPQFEEVPIPEPAPGQVLVKIAGAGACHSDLHVMEWPAGVVDWPIPFTLGHENAGWVQQLGARELGAEETLLSDQDTAANVRELTRGVGADLVLDFVGVDQTVALAAAMCRSRGELSIVGAAGGALAVSAATVPYDCTVVQPLWGTIVELMEVLELARSGHITSTIERFALADAPRAYEQMRAGTLRGRAVITPSG